VSGILAGLVQDLLAETGKALLRPPFDFFFVVRNGLDRPGNFSLQT
jgi:hypothetical protein